MALTRRELVQTLGATAGLRWLESSSTPGAAQQPGSAPTNRTVHLSGDGVGLTPRDYSALLDELAQRSDVAEDTYLLGGEVERFERQWARLLGKETAVFMCGRRRTNASRAPS